jgi:hypothetical protein
MSIRSDKSPAKALFTHPSMAKLAVFPEGAVSAADLASVFDRDPAALPSSTFDVTWEVLESDTWDIVTEGLKIRRKGVDRTAFGSVQNVATPLAFVRACLRKRAVAQSQASMSSCDAIPSVRA